MRKLSKKRIKVNNIKQTCVNNSDGFRSIALIQLQYNIERGGQT